MRDMVDAGEPYPLTAWQGPFKRIRTDLADAIGAGGTVSPADPAGDRDREQRRYLSASVAQFWDALDRIFAQARSGRGRRGTGPGPAVPAGPPGVADHRGRPAADSNNETEKQAADAPGRSTRASPGTSTFSWPRCWC